MTEILRLTVNWTGFLGGPGYTNLYFRDFSEGNVTQEMIDGAIERTDTWLDSFVPIVPTIVSFTLDSNVPVIETETGNLLRYENGVVDTTRVGTSAGVHVGGTGACVNWYTNVVRNNRRIRGRSFMIPLGLQAMTNDGTIDDTRLTAMRDATNTFLAPGIFGVHGVWARPNNTPPTNGEWAFTASYSINDKMAQLRSRRD